MTRRVHYAWVILAACFLGILAAQGARLSFGAFVLPWEVEFGVDRTTVSFVSLVSSAVYGLTQPVAVLSASVLLVGVSLVASAFARSPLELTLVYGVVATLGFGGASEVAASVAVTHWFNDRRELAFGIIEAGCPSGPSATRRA